VQVCHVRLPVFHCQVGGRTVAASNPVDGSLRISTLTHVEECNAEGARSNALRSGASPTMFRAAFTP
jgi:hypothetical protein